MAVQLTFYRLSEKKPEHREDIIWLKCNSSFGYESFEPRELSAEYSWFEVDEDGNQTGNQCCYTEGDGEILEGHVLEILFKGYNGRKLIDPRECGNTPKVLAINLSKR